MNRRTLQPIASLSALCALAPLLSCGNGAGNSTEAPVSAQSELLRRPSLTPFLSAPAGNLPAAPSTVVNGRTVAILPNGRFLTPAGIEIDVTAPKPYGLDLSPGGDVLATSNNGAAPFSVSLIRNWTGTPTVTRIDVDATFMGVRFAKSGTRFYASGGEDGNIWIGDTATSTIVGSVNLNQRSHPLPHPLAPNKEFPRFKGAYPGNIAESPDGRYLYVVDQAAFQVHVIDTTKITVGVDGNNSIAEPDNFEAIVARIPVGRYPYGVTVSPDGATLLVSHVGMFQYTHLRPENPTGDSNVDYPLCYPATGYPEETTNDKTIKIKKIDGRNVPPAQRDPEGIRCGYVSGDQTYTVPGLGDPNVVQSSSVYVIDVGNPLSPTVRGAVKPGVLIGQKDDGLAAYSGSHPNAVVVVDNHVYVANGNDDTISIYDLKTLAHISDVSLTQLAGHDHHLRGIQPVALAASHDGRTLYVAEAGINAIGVLRIAGSALQPAGHIPVGWWPSSVAVSADDRTLFVSNSKGRGATASSAGEPTTPKFTTMGTVNVIKVPGWEELASYTRQVVENNGFVPRFSEFDPRNPLPTVPGVESRSIKHIIFINKENNTHDALLGDITKTRRGVPVNGEPSYSLGYDTSPNHHELALSFTVGDNFYLEPTVSSDGHHWLTDTYTTEFEETHWPASYGGRRNDSGDDPAVFLPYPGRIGFVDANSSPEPNAYNEHGGIYLHLARHRKSFVNFGNGYEFALLDESAATEPTGVREHANVPMEKVVRDNSDHLYPEFNTHIPDAPLPEDPGRFSRFGRFKQVFEHDYVDRDKDTCNLPSYVDLYYPNDHGGGPRDVNPNGPDWSFKRYVQDNDAALGLTVELVSHSPCWKDTVIFVVEDDTQNGNDHVNGYRSLFLAISPWVKREHVMKTHASLASIFKTTEQILGIPSLNQYDAAATDLRDIFTDRPDFSPYTLTPTTYAMKPNRLWKALTKNIDFSHPDGDEGALRKAIMISEGLPRREARESKGVASARRRDNGKP